MKESTFTLGAIIIFLVVPSVSAQTTISLDSLIADVLRNNPQLQAARTRINSAETRIAQVQAWDDPQVGVEFYATPVTSLNPIRDGMETDYSIQQMIPFPGKKSLMGDAARANVQMVEQSATTVERRLIADVKAAYAMLYSAQRRLDINAENQRLLNQIIESARAKYSVGIATQGDVLKAQVELAKLQNERSMLEQELHTAEAMMNALRSVPSTTPIGRVADIIPQQFGGTLDDLQRRTLDNRPEIRGMKYEIEMNKAELAVSQRERLPDFMIRGMYKQMMVGTNLWAAMIGINIPIAPWASGKYSGRIEENELNIKAGEQSLRDMQNMVQFEVRDAWVKVQSQWEQIERYRTIILPQTEQTLQSALTSYQTDKRDFLSLLDSYRMLQMLKMEYYMHVGEYFSNLAALERAIGSNL
jgi:cobalt-zinc-cadmium efflux system outer membrane protein